MGTVYFTVLPAKFNTVNPLLSSLGGLSISSLFKGRGGAYLIQKRRWYQFPLKNYNIKRKSSSTRRFEVLPLQLVNKPSRISPHGVLQLWLINTVHQWRINRRGEGGGLINFILLKKGVLNSAFTVFCFGCNSWRKNTVELIASCGSCFGHIFWHTSNSVIKRHLSRPFAYCELKGIAPLSCV